MATKRPAATGKRSVDLVDGFDPVDADGRRARRDRNKVAVVDAFLDLVREGNPHPSVASVAERSGVSHRSVFRYFADRDEMARTSIERQQARLAPVLQLRIDPDQPFATRVDQVISQRLELFDQIGATARLSRSLALRQPIVQAQLTASRAKLRAGLKRVFAKELAALSPTASADTLAALDVLLSFESVELLRHDQSLTLPRVARVLRRAVRSLFVAAD